MKNFRCLFGKHEYLNFILQLAWIIIRLMFIALFVPSIYYYYELQNFSNLTGIQNDIIHWIVWMTYCLGGSYLLVPQLFYRVKN